MLLANHGPHEEEEVTGVARVEEEEDATIAITIDSTPTIVIEVSIRMTPPLTAVNFKAVGIRVVPVACLKAVWVEVVVCVGMEVV